MLLRQLHIEGFRNLARIELALTGGVTLFWGRNAQGKTNLLEAVHYLATGRSFRTRLDRECLPWAAEPAAVARIEGVIERGNTTHRLAVSLTERVKMAWVDGKQLARLGDLLGLFAVVVLTPDDIALAAGAPAARRRFLDMALSQVSPAYLSSLQSYQAALRQRNAMLRNPDSWRSGQSGPSAPDPWAPLLVQHGVEISLKRSAALREISALSKSLYAQIAPDDGSFSAQYRSASNIAPDDDREQARERFRRRLDDLRDADRERGHTLAGAHRDDFVVKVGGREVRDFGSQGQQRSVALTLRLAEVQWMRDQAGESPVLLVDDLGAELDSDRRTRLLSLFNTAGQTLATTAGDAQLLGRLIGAGRAIEVRGGALVGGA